MTDETLTAQRPAMPANPIKAGLITEGRSQLKWHALRDQGEAACSSYIPVSFSGDLAASIPPEVRCNSPACQKLFRQADVCKEQSNVC